jgi:predicted HTH transcriptional regulator
MAYSPEKILSILPLLDKQIADELETETLDFKECPSESKLRELAKEMAICFGNTAGGTVVFGVRERVIGCDKAIVGIDFAPDLEALNATLYDSIDPKLPVQFEWLMYGVRRLLLMHVHPSCHPTPQRPAKGGCGSARTASRSPVPCCVSCGNGRV